MTRPNPSPKSSHEKLLLLHRRIYRSLKSESTRLLGETPVSIRAYEREFQEDFSKLGGQLRAVSKSELIREIRMADVAFVADYHTFGQAQRTAIRLAREAIRPGELWWLGLEMIPSRHQAKLDAFQRGELRAEEFLSAIHYEEEWGFPWKHYAPIFDWAIANGVKLIALNLPKEARVAAYGADSGGDLGERDRWAAGIITDLFAGERARRRHGAQSRPRMIALYGELHVGREHLPRRLREISSSYLHRPIRSLSIHQNHEEVYWRLARQGRELGTEAVRLKRDAYCVISATPWAKLQSLVSWTEGQMAHSPPPLLGRVAPGAQNLTASAGRALDARLSDDWDESEGSIDYLSLMQSYGGTVAEFLGLVAPSFASLTPLTFLEAEKLLADIGADGPLSAEERYLARYHVLHNQRLYLHALKVAYLAVPSENAAAEFAAIHLYRSLRPTRRIFERTEEAFQDQILQSSFGFLGSLILNPRRKCDLAQDHRSRIAGLRRGEKPIFPHEVEARRLTLSLVDAGDRGWPPQLASMLPLRRLAPAVMAGARYYGQILAKALHRSIMDDALGPETIRKLCSPAPVSRRFELLRELAPVTRLGPSKTEHL